MDEKKYKQAYSVWAYSRILVFIIILLAYLMAEWRRWLTLPALVMFIIMLLSEKYIILGVRKLKMHINGAQMKGTTYDDFNYLFNFYSSNECYKSLILDWHMAFKKYKKEKKDERFNDDKFYEKALIIYELFRINQEITSAKNEDIDVLGINSLNFDVIDYVQDHFVYIDHRGKMIYLISNDNDLYFIRNNKKSKEDYQEIINDIGYDKRMPINYSYRFLISNKTIVNEEDIRLSSQVSEYVWTTL
ncbi:hypothetical protein EZV73_01580 [Acidaminobacter sp. JC074]|uniref:hypothetical protein n=1 Tax=Acidaminobacter sp. JC074 TaxID=2530199 RepID=UPI001F0F78BA|nr:hypothetical protein [Acidaminobacter sp. JC074]MCH4886235.1 hypothetical protein [Acidaminobacter sp. JC074]